MENKKKDIENYNEDSECHGYQEWYNNSYDNSIQFRGNCKNGMDIGYTEFHGYSIGTQNHFTTFYIV